MGLGNFIRVASKSALATGVVGVFYQSGLWKDSEQTIKNYDQNKAYVNSFVDSVPVLHDIVGDISRFAGKAVSPATQAVSNFREEWLDFDLSWTRNPDGIIKPAWNKAVFVTFDFIAHSPETMTNLAVAGWNKVSELGTDTSTTLTTSTTTGGSSAASSKPEGSSIKQ